MAVSRQIILGFVVLAYVGAARADLSYDVSHDAAYDVARPALSVASSSVSSLVRSVAGRVAWSADMLSGAPDLLDGSLLAGSALTLPSAPVLREIRPLPSSAAMFFTAMLSLGALHVFRHPPSLHLSALPQWYHSGGPIQVGHVTPLDLDFHSPVLCVFEIVLGGEDNLTILNRSAADQAYRLIPQVVLSPAAPRGPPLAA